MRIITISVSITLSVILTHKSVLAQTHSKVLPPHTLKRESAINSKVQILNLNQSTSFSLKPGWQILTQNSVDTQPLESESRSVRLGSFSLKSQPSSSTETYFVKSSPLVLYNSRLKNVGVLTGTFEIKLKPNIPINSLLTDYDLNLTQGFPHLSRFFVTPKTQTFNLKALYQSLSEDNRISSVQLEILDRSYEKQ